MKDANVDVRIKLRNIINDRGLNRADVARAAGLSPCQLYSVLDIRRRLEANEFLAICDFIHFTPQDVRGYQDQPA